MALQPYPAPKPVVAAPKPAAKAPDYIGGAIKGIGGLLGGLIKPPAQNNLPKPSLAAFPTLNATGYPTAAPMGVQAKAPAQNVKPPVTTIASSQIKAPSTSPQQAQPANNANVGGITPNGTVIGADGGASLNAQNNQNPNWQDAFTSHAVPGVTPQNGSPSPYTVNSGLYGQLIAALANRSQQPSQQYIDAYKAAQQDKAQLTQSGLNQQEAEGVNRRNPIPIGDQTGREAVIRNQYLGEQNALSNQLQYDTGLMNSANTQQGLLQQALQQAAAGAAPTVMTAGQYQQSPLSGGAVDATSGMQQGIQNATNYGVAQQNISQATQYQAQAQTISNGLQLLQAISPRLTDFISSAKLNTQDLPVLNQQINKIDSQTNPAAYATMQAVLSSAKSYIQQMLQATGGMTPTDAGNLADTYAASLGNLKPDQLAIFLKNMEVEGNLRLNQTQSAAEAARQANLSGGGAPAQGVTANTGGQFDAGGAAAINGLPTGLKLLGGIGISAAPTLINAAEGAVIGGPAGAAAAVIGPGIAAKFFGQ